VNLTTRQIWKRLNFLSAGVEIWNRQKYFPKLTSVSTDLVFLQQRFHLNAALGKVGMADHDKPKDIALGLCYHRNGV
jgi:hypothetical protein